MLKARTTDQCRGLVRISFRVPVIRPRFTDIAKDLRPRIPQRIHAQRIHFDFDAGEFILLLFDLRRDIDADIVCQIDRSEGQLIVFDLFLDIGSRHMKKLRQAAERLIRQRIPLAIDRHDDAVCRARARKYQAIPVIHDTTHRLHGKIADAVPIRFFFIIPALNDLHIEKTQSQDEQEEDRRIDHTRIAGLLGIFQKPTENRGHMLIHHFGSPSRFMAHSGL